MAEAASRALPRGRHGLSREEVVTSQRIRLVEAMAEALADGGYAATPVAAIIKRAGVSRLTFYELYDSKLAAFLDALDVVGAVLVGELENLLVGDGDPVHRIDDAIDRYFELLREQPAYAQLYQVEVHAAGPEALRRRMALQDRVVDAVARVAGLRTPEERFAAKALIAATSALVVLPLTTGDTEEFGPLAEQLKALAHQLLPEA